MITKNGAPQFDFDYDDIVNANELLREWAESRRCVRCKWFYREDSPKIWRCDKLLLGIKTPETFSCAAFEPLSPIETAGGDK